MIPSSAMRPSSGASSIHFGMALCSSVGGGRCVARRPDAELALAGVGFLGVVARGELALLQRRWRADPVDRGQALREQFGCEIGALDGADGDRLLLDVAVDLGADDVLAVRQSLEIEPRVGAEIGTDVRRGDAEQADQAVADPELVAVDHRRHAFDGLAGGGRDRLLGHFADRHRGRSRSLAVVLREGGTGCDAERSGDGDRSVHGQLVSREWPW